MEPLLQLLGLVPLWVAVILLINKLVPEKRALAQETELRMIIREEIKKALWEAWPEKTGGVKGLNKPKPEGDYRENTPVRQ